MLYLAFLLVAASTVIGSEIIHKRTENHRQKGADHALKGAALKGSR